jgi:hypothetical protein
MYWGNGGAAGFCELTAFTGQFSHHIPPGTVWNYQIIKS